MHAFHLATQIGQAVVAAAAFISAVLFFRSPSMLSRFGRCHATPLARICDAVWWFPRQLRANHKVSAINAAVHFAVTAVVPVGAVLVTNVSAVVQHPVYFGLAGTVAGVIAEGPELFARNAQYANAQYGSLSHGEAQSSDRKVAKCALIGAAVEVLLVALLYYVGYVAHGLSATLGAVALGVAFVAAAEVMSVASTLSVVLRGGRPFRTSW